MTCSLEFTGSIVVPGVTLGIGTTAASEKRLMLQFAQITRQFATVVSTDCPFALASPGVFASMPLSDELVTADFIVFTVLDQGTIDFLIGDLPRFVGTGGTFPTLFAGGETFVFELQTYNDVTGAFDVDFTVTPTFTVAAQSAQDVANEINAAVMLSGASTQALVAVSSGQLLLKGTTPGAIQRLEITTANATIGFDGTKVADLGTGSPVVVNGNFLAEVASIPGVQLWLRGTANLNILLAGT